MYEVITDRGRLCDVHDAWSQLWEDAGGTLFQSHAWIYAWSIDGDDHCLRIGCAWQGDTLLAVLPLCVRRWHGLRVLEWAAQPYSDYCDVLCRSYSSAILAKLWALITHSGGFDLARLKHVPSEAALRPLLQYVGMTEERSETCLKVTGHWPNGTAWFRSLNKKTRNNYTRGKRILSEHGRIAIRQLGDDEPREPVIARLVQLKREWRQNRHSPLVRNDTTLLALVGALDRNQSLRIFLIECAGTIIAGSINAVQGDKMLAMFASYDPAFDRAGPGIILMTEYTMWAFDKGITEIDFLVGVEPYKFKFANREVKLHIYIKPRTLLGRVAVAIYKGLQRRRPADRAVTIGSAYLTAKGTPRAVQQATRRQPEADPPLTD